VHFGEKGNITYIGPENIQRHNRIPAGK